MHASQTPVNFLSRKVPLYFAVLVILLTSAITYFIIHELTGHPEENASVRKMPVSANNMSQLRLKESKLTNPLILADVVGENPSFLPIKSDIEQFINQLKGNQKVVDVSVYFRKLNDGSWFSINSNQLYNPASMIKVAYLLSYLKDAERNPSLLDKKIFFRQHYSAGNNPNIVDFKLKEGLHYPIRDLLYAMIVYSDNDATGLLMENVNASTFSQLFTDLNIPVPDIKAEYFISSVDMGKFFRVLYNASYLRKETSEYALELLSKSSFKDGIVAGVNSTTLVAHKFGERIIGNTAQLHEFGIVYFDGQPYLLGIMTMGNSMQELKSVLKEIARKTDEDYRRLIGT